VTLNIVLYPVRQVAERSFAYIFIYILYIQLQHVCISFVLQQQFNTKQIVKSLKVHGIWNSGTNKF